MGIDLGPEVELAIQGWIPHHRDIRLCSLVTHDAHWIHIAADVISHTFGMPRVDVASGLPDALSNVPLRRRTRHSERWLEARCRADDRSPVLVSGIDLLFHPKLGVGPDDRLNPLVLFRRISRHTPLLVLWPGTYDGDTLAYATPGHAHHRLWPDPEAKIITVPVP